MSNTYSLIARTDRFQFVPGVPIVTQTAVQFTPTFTLSANQARFTYFGTVVRQWLFPAESKILITQGKITIPNLPGIQLSYESNRLSPGIPFAATATGGASTIQRLPIYSMDNSQSLNMTSQTPTAGEDFYLSLTPNFNDWVWLDTRNILSIYNGIEVFIQVELTVVSPGGIA
jgi:hypothetical protein